MENILIILFLTCTRWSSQVNACTPALTSFFTQDYEDCTTLPPKLSENLITTADLLNGLQTGLLEVELKPAVFYCPHEEGIFRDKFDCTIYYECLDGNFEEKKCQCGFAFSEKELRCVPRDDAKCDLGPVDQGYKCLANGLDPNPIDCTRFYLCIGEKAFSQKCKEGKKFDKNAKICLDEKKSSCFLQEENL